MDPIAEYPPTSLPIVCIDMKLRRIHSGISLQGVGDFLVGNKNEDLIPMSVKLCCFFPHAYMTVREGDFLKLPMYSTCICTIIYMYTCTCTCGCFNPGVLTCWPCAIRCCRATSSLNLARPGEFAPKLERVAKCQVRTTKLQELS